MNRKEKKGLYLSICAFILLLLSCTFLVYIPEQTDFSLIASGYLLAFTAYLVIYKYIKSNWFFAALLIGILIRLILIFALPNLSDDLYRFIWDGRLIHHAISPYAHIPTSILGLNLEGIDQALYEALNSQNYYSVYPPISQFIFYLGSWPSLSIYESNLIMKSVLLLIELIGFHFFLKILRGSIQDNKKSNILFLVVFLNPLLIVETAGNLHFEGAVVSLLAIGLYHLQKKKYILSGLFIAISIGVKLTPLVLLPFIFFKLKSKSRWIFTTAVSSFLILIFLPFFNGIELNNFLQSIDLYFSKFEFNGSFYIILRAIGNWYSGFNQIAFIGPSTATFVVLFCCIYIFKSIRNTNKLSIQDLAHYGLAGLSIYYFTSTTVHPWYIINLLFLCVFTKFRFPIVWTILITLTYINYSYSPYKENFWIVGIEYILLYGFLAYELFSSKVNKIMLVRNTTIEAT